MPPQQNSSGSPFSMDWLHQSTTASQPFSHFSAIPNHYIEAEYTSNQGMGLMGSSFAPQALSFGLRDGVIDELPSMRSNSSGPSNIPPVSAVRPASMDSTLEHRLPRVQDFYEPRKSQPDHSHQRPMQPPPKPRRSAPHTLTQTPINWEEHLDEITRLWKNEDRTLPETIKIMTKEFGFTAS